MYHYNCIVLNIISECEIPHGCECHTQALSGDGDTDRQTHFKPCLVLAVQKEKKRTGLNFLAIIHQLSVKFLKGLVAMKMTRLASH